MRLRRKNEPRRAADYMARLRRRGGWMALEVQFGKTAVVEYMRFLVVKVLDEDYSSEQHKLHHEPGPMTGYVWAEHVKAKDHYARCCFELHRNYGTIVEHDPTTVYRACSAVRYNYTKRRLEQAFGPYAERVAPARLE